jgi:hypothetical protein
LGGNQEREEDESMIKIFYTHIGKQNNETHYHCFKREEVDGKE